MRCEIFRSACISASLFPYLAIVHMYNFDLAVPLIFLCWPQLECMEWDMSVSFSVQSSLQSDRTDALQPKTRLNCRAALRCGVTTYVLVCVRRNEALGRRYMPNRPGNVPALFVDLRMIVPSQA
jgi:hypothetical protein